MKFFKAEDFTKNLHPATNMYGFILTPEEAANLANNKLESEGIKVFTMSTDKRYWTDPNDPSTQDVPFNSDLQGFVVGVEKNPEIENCKHESFKIKLRTHAHPVYFSCECGKKVQPTNFEEIK